MLRAPVLALAAGFLLLGGIVVSIALFALNLQNTTDSIAGGLQRTLTLSELLSHLQSAETGQRGFLLTDDNSYLASHTGAIDGARRNLDTLATAESGGFQFPPDLITRLRDAVQAKIDELAMTLELARNGRKAEALTVVRSDRGETLMNDIRDAIGLMRAFNAGAISDSIAHERSVAFGLWVGIATAAIGIVLMATIILRDTRMRLQLLRQRTAELESRNRALEDTNVQLSEEIASREAAEQQLRQLHKMEAIGQLSGGIAHDFNNMLAVVMSAISLSRRRLARGETDISEYLSGAAEAAERAATLTARLLAFSRQQPLQPEPLEPNKLVSNMSELLHRTLGETISLEAVLGAGLWRVRVDPNQLENAILNLAVNARDAMPEGGKITIETTNAHIDEAYARTNPGADLGQAVMIAVSDTGEGMSAETVAHAFDPFFTTKAPGKGTGLGLSQVYGFVKQSNGHIKIYSEPGRGTTVKLYLPRYLGEETIGPARRAVPSGELVRGSEDEIILVTEDDEQVREMVRTSLREIGYTVVDTGDPEEALRLLAERPDIGLLFTDIVMPKMTGRVLVERAREERPELKVLYTTGFTRNAVVHNGVLDAGVNLIVKPFTVEQLAAKVREVLDGA